MEASPKPQRQDWADLDDNDAEVQDDHLPGGAVDADEASEDPMALDDPWMPAVSKPSGPKNGAVLRNGVPNFLDSEKASPPPPPPKEKAAALKPPPAAAPQGSERAPKKGKKPEPSQALVEKLMQAVQAKKLMESEGQASTSQGGDKPSNGTSESNGSSFAVQKKAPPAEVQLGSSKATPKPTPVKAKPAPPILKNQLQQGGT
mmetsp:Transcript_19265/g.36127  ORF Transcript_19265/g.36127 Transcript_19265/m.36127 type:complete len:203 (+) Transcript_19265:2-610(+)